MSDFIPVLTIDGPSGSGKGTISRKLSKYLDWHLLDSGALYRLLAYYALQCSTDLSQELLIAKLAVELPVYFAADKIYLQDCEVTNEIRTENCGEVASRIAAMPKVREALLLRQREFLQLPGLVADGRDMGTEVFPEAFLKIYLDASVEERAKRRYLQLKESGLDVKLQYLAGEIARRDERDKSRVASPLRPADDAIVLDTTNMGIQEVFDRIIQGVKQHKSC